MSAAGRWFVSFWVALSLAACSPMQTVPHAQASANVQRVLQAGDDVRLVTVTNEAYAFRVTEVGPDTLYGQSGETTFEVPFPAIAKLEVRRKVERSTGHSGARLHGKGAGEAVLVLVVVVVVVALGAALFRVVGEQVEEYRRSREEPPPPTGPRRIVVPLPPGSAPARVPLTGLN